VILDARVGRQPNRAGMLIFSFFQSISDHLRPSASPMRVAVTATRSMGTLSEGFERFVVAPLLPRRLRMMVHTV
jgi:hypothetical protein